MRRWPACCLSLPPGPSIRSTRSRFGALRARRGLGAGQGTDPAVETDPFRSRRPRRQCSGGFYDLWRLQSGKVCRDRSRWHLPSIRIW